MTNVTILGFGVVGSGVYEIINNNKKLKDEVNINNVLVRNVSKHKEENPLVPFTNSVQDLDFENTDVLIEVIGGTTLAYDLIKKALQNKTNVITANKDLISLKYKGLYTLAKENGVNIFFEASVGGSLPIINLLNTNFKFDKVSQISGILNGTTNFILSKMKHEGLTYKEALQLAQDNGFAESDPSSDVLGWDAGRKIAILSSIAYQKDISFEDVITNGITEIDDKIIDYANENDYTIKLVATSKNENGVVSLEVAPKLVANTNSLSQVNNENNIVILKTSNCNEQVLIAPGAGKLPTANSIISDLNNILFNKISVDQQFDTAQINNCTFKNVVTIENGEVVCKQLKIDEKSFNEVYEILG